MSMEEIIKNEVENQINLFKEKFENSNGVEINNGAEYLLRVGITLGINIVTKTLLNIPIDITMGKYMNEIKVS